MGELFKSENERLAAVRNTACQITLNSMLQKIEKQKHIRSEHFRVNASVFRKHAKHMQISIRIPRVGDRERNIFNGHKKPIRRDAANDVDEWKSRSQPVLPPILTQKTEPEASFEAVSTAPGKCQADTDHCDMCKNIEDWIKSQNDTTNTFLTSMSLSDIDPYTHNQDDGTTLNNVTHSAEVASQPKAPRGNTRESTKHMKQTNKLPQGQTLTKPVFARSLPARYETLPRIGNTGVTVYNDVIGSNGLKSLTQPHSCQKFIVDVTSHSTGIVEVNNESKKPPEPEMPNYSPQYAKRLTRKSLQSDGNQIRDRNLLERERIRVSLDAFFEKQSQYIDSYIKTCEDSKSTTNVDE